ncbi:conjugative transfer signal peptidase TraF [Bradyrhizobium diazoefficiens]|uniref:Conjugative transfer signal peptidase TraF n=1 Tax=Bradyrhizobium barranii subsp. barranii TaxID=2823807 RepID=A0A7Z0TX86_9BRAD|nr:MULTISPECIES: conjugative transfer signal peptidase TraF [Bradyrhizobium]MBR0868103.1 conjugative transfer signal peptidase TraF [Bradyrhizobium diazoefficiens]MBR0892593.1 conjugative transfer signal peptidase TraF [Bradyrhizobium diazoefficiens]MBR0924324.1 conjugative transfer signal peptidase TraF [Bradyrhizobium diazoefficiens]UGX89859.1 conjugative transfer signal peptidase TraF [Bradyrhizobium barranii subsp. barranii]UGX99535.1 conjugative transfer signal peptidase TraF [Bradyrhizob
MSIRRFPLVILMAGAGLIAAMAGAGWGAGLRINMTASYPRGLWRIETLDRAAATGDLVFICPPDTAEFERAFARGYIRRGLCAGGISPLIKTVVAVSGQQVDVAEQVSIDGYPLPDSDVRQTDAAGRPLLAFAGGVIPDGELYLHSDFAGSYDSRYFGPIPSSGVLGLARPVFTFGP